MSIRQHAIVRLAHPHDYVEVCRLMDSLDELHRNRLPWMFKAPDVPARSGVFFSDLLRRDDAVVFVAEAEHLIGAAFGLMRNSPEFPVFIPQRWGVLDNLVVESAWRRRGVGKALTHAIEHWALNRGAHWMELSVYDFNEEARRFYQSLGYLPVATRMRRVISERAHREDAG